MAFDQKIFLSIRQTGGERRTTCSFNSFQRWMGVSSRTSWRFVGLRTRFLMILFNSLFNLIPEQSVWTDTRVKINLLLFQYSTFEAKDPLKMSFPGI